jgi:hypothetical protein
MFNALDQSKMYKLMFMFGKVIERKKKLIPCMRYISGHRRERKKVKKDKI